MKKRFSLFTIIAVLATVTVAFAIQGRQPKDGGGVSIQNAAAIAPVPSASRCDSSTATKGTLKSYSSAGYSQICYKAVNSTTGAAVIVKRRLNSNAAGTGFPGSGDCITNDKPYTGGWAVQKIVLDRYSGASSAVTTCVERQ